MFSGRTILIDTSAYTALLLSHTADRFAAGLKSHSKKSAFLLMFLFICSAGAFASENNSVLSCGAEAGYNSSYIWDGVVVNESAVVQPSAYVSVGDFTVEGWGNLVANGSEKFQNRFNETSLSVSCETEVGEVGIEPFLEYYIYPGQENDNPSTGMLSVKMSVPFGLFKAVTTQSVDVAAYKGAYYGEAGLIYPGACRHNLSFEISAKFGWASSYFNNTYNNLDKTALDDFQAGFSANYRLTPTFHVVPHFELYTFLDNDLIKATNRARVVNFGVNFTYDL